MTKKGTGGRFDFLGSEQADQQETPKEQPDGGKSEPLAQLNVRIPQSLKRAVSAKAAMDGEKLNTVIERVLREWLEF
jgi:HicB family.